jgi:hypothetical protein
MRELEPVQAPLTWGQVDMIAMLTILVSTIYFMIALALLNLEVKTTIYCSRDMFQ